MTRPTRCTPLLLGSAPASLCGWLTASSDDLGCAHGVDVAIATQELSRCLRARIFYFADETCSTRVGAHFQNCGGSSSYSGITTAFTSGYVEPCDFSSRYGCMAYLASGPACPPLYAVCVEAEPTAVAQR